MQRKKRKTSENTSYTGRGQRSLKDIQKSLLRSQLILIITLALFLGGAGTLINIQFEMHKRDQNLRNVAETIARSPLLLENRGETAGTVLMAYLDSLKETLQEIDVISVLDEHKKRFYHSNHTLIGTVYDENLPNFELEQKGYDIINERGPSGKSRRAYAAVYDTDGRYIGCVMAVVLMENIQEETLQTLFLFVLITVAAICMELAISKELSGRIRESLLGYEPDVFTAMYQIRDNILEALDEGILAIDQAGEVQFANKAALEMLAEEPVSESAHSERAADLQNKNLGMLTQLNKTLSTGEKEWNANLEHADILIDRIPIKEDGLVIGAVGILRNRTEYTKLMEDLTGTRYLVDSMRANNHDFTNKLHVILGLIQMEMYDEAVSYIENITIVQRETISSIMHAINEPALAALLIGKTARASELNIKFILREGCRYASADANLPSDVLVTIIGNLIDNAFEALNESTEDFETQKELMFGIYSKPGAVLITADDTGCGITEAQMKHIFENKYSTKGEGRGTGLYQVKALVEGFGGTIAVESQPGVGTSFSVSFVRP